MGSRNSSDGIVGFVSARENHVHGIGRFVQLIGLVLTGVGLFLGLLQGDIRGELVLLAVGSGIFFSGRLVEKKGGGA